MMMAFIETNVEKTTIPCLLIAYHFFLKKFGGAFLTFCNQKLFHVIVEKFNLEITFFASYHL
jgi:hypothetical protein